MKTIGGSQLKAQAGWVDMYHLYFDEFTLVITFIFDRPIQYLKLKEALIKLSGIIGANEFYKVMLRKYFQML